MAAIDIIQAHVHGYITENMPTPVGKIRSVETSIVRDCAGGKRVAVFLTGCTANRRCYTCEVCGETFAVEILEA